MVVCPFGEECPDKPFCFPVGLWPIRACSYVFNPEIFTCVLVKMRAVTSTIVGHDTLHLNPVGAIERDCAFEEPDRGICFLVMKNFCVRES